jgi:hypothetical protein
MEFFLPDKLLVDSGPIAGSPGETFPGFVVILPSAIQFSFSSGSGPATSGNLPVLPVCSPIFLRWWFLFSTRAWPASPVANGAGIAGSPFGRE